MSRCDIVDQIEERDKLSLGPRHVKKLRHLGTTDSCR
jgi:hypothetical protein